MADIYKIAESWMAVWVHSGPSTSYPHVGIIYGKNNESYTVTDRQNSYWLKIGEGRWACDRDWNGMIVMVKTGTSNTEQVKPPVDPEAPKDEEETETKPKEVSDEEYSFIPPNDPISFTEEEFETSLEENLSISSLRGIFGMPYQFMESADPRISNKPGAIGRKYAKEIISTMPLLLLRAGLPVFMAGYGDDDKNSIINKFASATSGMESQISETVLSEDFGKYYSLKYADEEYFEYVNPMCRIAARMMNLQDKSINGTKLESYNWLHWAAESNANFAKIFNVYNGCTAWYCDSDTNISDSWSNSTGESMIASKINSVSDYGRELNFLLGTVNSKTNPGSILDELTNPDALAEKVTNVTNFISGSLGQNSISSIFKSLTNSIQTVVAGGKLVFPELWTESNFSRSYDVKLKLVSPDGDDLSIYLNIIVPILHLLGYTLPREYKNGHGYNSPFLVRGFYKGLFNVDMGIISDLTITKGKESAWTPSGIPSIVEVSFTIKDLYNDMYMTNMNNMRHNTMNNIILMDYIANLCGVNINEPDVLRGIDLFFIQNIKNRITDTWHMKVVAKLQQYISNKVQQVFGKF